jgi:Ni2+-binding GTPase involved in maturation of urease and hydrogenase
MCIGMLTLVVNGAHQRQVNVALNATDFHLRQHAVDGANLSRIEIILLSATSGEGMDQWLTWLETQRCA